MKHFAKILCLLLAYQGLTGCYLTETTPTPDPADYAGEVGFRGLYKFDASLVVDHVVTGILTNCINNRTQHQVGKQLCTGQAPVKYICSVGGVMQDAPCAVVETPLQTAIRLHVLWLSSNNGEGARLIWSDFIAAHPDVTSSDFGALFAANLTAANLRNADLTDANLLYVNLNNATLAGATLTAVDMRYANLTAANLSGADLTGTKLLFANLTAANLTGSDLHYVNLRYTILTDADLTGADLTGADLTGANLTGADLTGANLNSANLTDAECDQDTILPQQYQCNDGYIEPSTP